MCYVCYPKGNAEGYIPATQCVAKEDSMLFNAVISSILEANKQTKKNTLELILGDNFY